MGLPTRRNDHSRDVSRRREHRTQRRRTQVSRARGAETEETANGRKDCSVQPHTRREQSSRISASRHGCGCSCPPAHRGAREVESQEQSVDGVVTRTRATHNDWTRHCRLYCTVASHPLAASKPQAARARQSTRLSPHACAHLFPSNRYHPAQVKPLHSLLYCIGQTWPQATPHMSE